ncbi:MAG: hypothetical protein HQL32_08575 [Planctomycetes bacterium]|nr:hypothetical protein [Planctomycetota bacterium]
MSHDKKKQLFMLQRFSKIHGESGFALVMTVAVLMGILAIVVPLVRINRANFASSREYDNQYRLAPLKKSALAIADSYLRSKALANYSTFMKNSMVPGGMNIPVEMYSVTDITDLTSTTVNVSPSAMLRLFFTFATNRIDDGNGIIYLDTLTALPYALETDTTVDGFPVGDADLAAAGYTLSDDFLLVINNELMYYDGADKIFRGEGGVLTEHLVDSPVFLMPQKVQASGDPRGFLKMGTEWMKVTAINMGASTFTVTRSFGGTGTTHSNGGLIEYYPCYLGSSKSDVGNNNFSKSELSAFIRCEFVDERSKINANSSADILGFTSPGDKWSTLDAFALADSDETRRHKKDLTVYSFPNIVAGDGFDTTLRHPVNFNTASVFVMSKVLNAMGITTAGLAEKIELYRSDDINDPVIEYIVDSNPFDGYDSSAGKYYASAQHEFLALMKEEISAPQYRELMDVVFGDGDFDPCPIVFEMGSVVTMKGLAGVKSTTSATASVVDDFSVVYMAGPDVNEVSGSIILDDFHGWNPSHSIMNGLVSGPRELSANMTSTSNTLMVAADRKPNKTDKFSHVIADHSIVGSAVGLIGGNSIIHLALSGNTSDNVIYNIIDTAKSDPLLDYEKGTPIGFGLRPIAWKRLVTGYISEPAVINGGALPPDGVKIVGNEYDFIEEDAAVDKKPLLLINNINGNKEEFAVMEYEEVPATGNLILGNYQYGNVSANPFTINSGVDTTVAMLGVYGDIFHSTESTTYETTIRGDGIKITGYEIVTGQTLTGNKSYDVTFDNKADLDALIAAATPNVDFTLKFTFENGAGPAFDGTYPTLAPCPQLLRIIINYKVEDMGASTVIADSELEILDYKD